MPELLITNKDPTQPMKLLVSVPDVAASAANTFTVLPITDGLLL